MSPDTFKTLNEIFGVVASILAALKVSTFWLRDRSLQRKIKHIVTEIETNLSSLDKLNQVKSKGFTSLPLDSYETEVLDGLGTALDQLRAQQEKRKQKSWQRNALPTGIRKTLLLFRPVPLEEWIAHGLFYTFLVEIIRSCIEITLSHYSPFSLINRLITLPVLGLFVIYLHSVSLRLKQVTADDVNWGRGSDLPLMSRILLVTKPSGWRATTVHCLYYIFVLECVSMPTVELLFRYPLAFHGEFFRTLPFIMLNLLFPLSIAIVLRWDALSRRPRRHELKTDVKAGTLLAVGSNS